MKYQVRSVGILIALSLGVVLLTCLSLSILPAEGAAITDYRKDAPVFIPDTTALIPAKFCVADYNSNSIVDVQDIMATAAGQSCLSYLQAVSNHWHLPWSNFGGSYGFIDSNHGFTDTTYIDLSLVPGPTAYGLGNENFVNLTLYQLNPPFEFKFYGLKYDRIGVTSNGYLVVGGVDYLSEIQFANPAIPTSTLPNNIIAPYWADLNMFPNSPGGIFYAAVSLATPRQVILQYKDIFRQGYPATHLDFEVILTEGDPNIVMLYHTVTDTLNILTVGLENLTGTGGTQYYYNNDVPGNRPTSGLGILWSYDAGASSPPAAPPGSPPIQKLQQHSPEFLPIPGEIIKGPAR